MKVLLRAYAGTHSLICHMLHSLHVGLLQLGVDSNLLVYADHPTNAPDAEIARSVGIETGEGVIFCGQADGLAQQMLELSKDGSCPFFVEINAKSDLSALAGRVRHFNIMIDPPYGHLEGLRRLSTYAVGNTSVDRSSPAMYNDLGLARPQFLPHGGPPADPVTPSTRDRPIDILFVGNFVHSPHADFLESYWGPDTHPFVRKIFLEAAERTVAGAEPWRAYVDAGRSCSVDVRTAIPLEAGARIATDLLNWSRARRRLLLLQGLKTCQITVAGVVGDGFFPSKPENVSFRGPVSGVEVRELFRQSKLVLNSCHAFPQGSHERIWYAMAEGAVVVTDRTDFVAEDFTDARHLFYLPPDLGDLSPCDQQLRNLTASPGQLDAIRDAATSVYAGRHDWAERACHLKSILQSIEMMAAN